MSPRDRFKDAKEKFLLLEEQEKQMQRRRNLQAAVEQPISPAVLPTAGNSRGELLYFVQTSLTFAIPCIITRFK